MWIIYIYYVNYFYVENVENLDFTYKISKVAVENFVEILWIMSNYNFLIY